MTILYILVCNIMKADTEENAEEEAKLTDEETEDHMKQLIKNHPDCVPVYFAKHKEASKELKHPSQPLYL